MNVQCLTLCALCFCIGLQSHGQLKIGGDPYQIHPYALLELESSERALVLPRLSTLLLRIRDFYGGFSLSNWNLSDARETYTLDSSLLQYKVLFGGVFELLSKHRFHGVLGMEKEDSKYSYWTRLQW